MESMSKLKPVKPTKPVAAYLGGKSRLAKTIIHCIDQIPHTCYAEPFVGMGGIFLRRSSAPKAEVINDYNGEVANLYRILQRHYVAFLEMMRYQITSRRHFDDLVSTDPSTLTDLQRAARFIYIQKLAFGGMVNSKSFRKDVSRSGAFNVTKLVPMLEDVHERLAGVTLENKDYKEFITQYDTVQTLFYLDPPYYGNEGDYGKNLFCRDEFTLMAALLKDIKGSFILSLNDCEAVRSIFKGFNILTTATTYTLSAKTAPKKVSELIISNKELSL